MSQFHVCGVCGREWKFDDCTVGGCSRGGYPFPCPLCYADIPEGQPTQEKLLSSSWNYVDDELTAFVSFTRKKAGIVDNS